MRGSREGDKKDSSTILETTRVRMSERDYAQGREEVSRALRSRQRGSLWIASRKGREHCWKFHAKHSAAGLRVVAKNLPRVLLNDAKADAESKASAFADWLGGVEGVKN